MAQTPGLGISEELTNAFSGAITSKNVRFLKISIRNGPSLFTSPFCPPSYTVVEYQNCWFPMASSLPLAPLKTT